MKKILMFFIVFKLININLIAAEFTFRPLIIDFKDIAVRDDTLLAYGNYGSMLLSYNDGDSWSQIRVFDKGTIVKIYIEDTAYTAFSDFGLVSVSRDKGKTWQIKKDLGDSVLAVIKYPKGYFLRSWKKLFTVDFNFEKQNEYQKNTQSLGTRSCSYDKTLIYFKNILIADIDSVRFLLFDENLNFLDTFSLKKFDESEYHFGTFENLAGSDYFYFKTYFNIYKTKDFESVETVFYELDRVCKMTLIDEELHILLHPSKSGGTRKDFFIKLCSIHSNDSLFPKVHIRTRELTYGYQMENFIIKNNKVYIVGENKIILNARLDDSVFQIKSNFRGGIASDYPDISNDGKFIFLLNSDRGAYNSIVYMSEDSCITFKPTIDGWNNPVIRELYTFNNKYFDKENNALYLGTRLPDHIELNKDLMYISNDFGKSFISKEVEDFYFINHFFRPYSPYLTRFPNYYKTDSNFVLSKSSYSNYEKKGCFSINRYNMDFELIDMYNDSNLVIDYIISSIDTNNFYIHCFNLQDSTTDFRYTVNRGAEWKIIKKYPLTDSLLYYKEFKYQNKRMLAVFYITNKDSVIHLDVLDVKAKNIKNIFNYKIDIIPNTYYGECIYQNGICSDEEYVYIVAENSLYVTNDLYDKGKWKKYNFPDSGRVYKLFEKYGNKFFAGYKNNCSEWIPWNLYFINIEGLDVSIPKITSHDYDFGKIDIHSDEIADATIKIENSSDEYDLVINSYTPGKNKAFSTNLPKAEEMEPILLKPKDNFEFTVFFKPEESGIYRDSIIFHSNASMMDSISYLGGEGIDTVISYKAESLELLPYLYAYPPFPLPASDEIRVKLYWDTSLEMSPDNISIYNIFGKKIPAENKIRIDKLNNYSGYMKWNCASVPSGIYLIRIKHGTKTQLVKVIVSR